MVKITSAAILLLTLCACLAKGQDTVQRTTLWKANEDGIFAHFVYGLIVRAKGTILAFACLYGHGGSGHMPETVSLARFSLQWLLENEE